MRNPLPRAATLEVRLVGADGWQGETALVRADAHAEATTELTITPSGPCRQPFAAELTAEGRCFGQVAEALATLGHDRF